MNSLSGQTVKGDCEDFSQKSSCPVKAAITQLPEALVDPGQEHHSYGVFIAWELPVLSGLGQWQHPVLDGRSESS